MLDFCVAWNSTFTSFSMSTTNVLLKKTSIRFHGLDCGAINPLMGTLKLHRNGPLYINTVIGTLAVDGWVVTFGTARRGLGGLRPRLTADPSTANNFIILDVAL